MEFDFQKPEVISWLSQFSGTDQNLAYDLLEQVHFVSADEFQRKLTQLIIERGNIEDSPTALYAERSIRTWKNEPNRLFKEKNAKVTRAYGSGPEPVKSTHTGRHETGSEGIVSTLITQITRKYRTKFLNHPGPDAIRKNKVRRFVLVTDFIGSGTQVSRYLDAAWRIASVKSWKSGKFLRFEVVCFSAAQQGLSKLLAHPTKPIVSQVVSCPTVQTYEPFSGADLVSLCNRYGPTDAESEIPRLGYGDVGALIAFAHGMPNNAPRLFFVKGRKWKPLFMSRVVSLASIEMVEKTRQKISLRLIKMREDRLSRLAGTTNSDSNSLMTTMVLTSLKRAPRTAEVVSARTGLGIAECVITLDRLKVAGWIDEKNRLQPKAFVELKYLRERSPLQQRLARPAKSLYVPKKLRAP